MATAPQLELAEETGTGLVPAAPSNAGIVLMDREKFNAWYEALKAKAPTHADVGTRKGREELRSFAATVRSEKAAIDKARLRLTKEWRDMTAQANAAGKEIEQQLEALAVEVRAPLTAWEEAEKAREDRCKALIESLRQAVVLPFGATAEDARERLTEVKAVTLDPVELDGFGPQAALLHEQAVATLTYMVDQLTREEAERAELQRLRAEAEAREAKEAAEREAREQAEAARLAAEAAERRRIEAEEAEAQRIRDAEERAAQAARDEEARKAREAEEQRQREHEAALAEERRQREEAERIAREEQQRRQREEAEAARQAEEDRKREANRAHRTRVQRAAKEAIMTCGADEDTARKIVLAIIAGEIPAVTLAF